jgi:hypothetical protein
MKLLSGLHGIALAVGMACHAQAASPPVCSESQLAAYAPKPDEVASHRKLDAPSITYPFGVDPGDDWGFSVTLRIDESGAVTCYQTHHDFFEREVVLSPQRRTLIESLTQWRYGPFVQNGRAVAARVTEEVYEQEAARSHVAPPDVPIGEVRIGLRRTTCYGNCPSYSVDLYGDGRVVYRAPASSTCSASTPIGSPRSGLPGSWRACGRKTSGRYARATTVESPTTPLTS